MQTAHSSFQHRPGWGRSAICALAVISAVGQVQRLAAQDDNINVAHVTISLVRQCEIPSRDAGTLSEILVREGQRVSQGDIVATLENDRETLNLNASKLNLQVAVIQSEDTLGVQSAAAQLAEYAAARRVKEVGLAIAKAEADSDVAVQVSSAETKLRELELERAENARTSFKGSISEAQLDRLKTAVEKGRLEIQQAIDEHEVRRMKPKAEQAALDQTTEQVTRYKSLVKQEEQLLEVASVTKEIRANDVAMAQLRLEHRNLRAPFDGVIAAVERNAGEWVEPGTSVARMIDLNTLQAEGFLPAELAFQDLVGRSVRIQLSTAGSVRDVSGKITFVSSEIDPVNLQVRFRAEFDNSMMVARPGMSGSLTIEK